MVSTKYLLTHNCAWLYQIGLIWGAFSSSAIYKSFGASSDVLLAPAADRFWFSQGSPLTRLYIRSDMRTGGSSWTNFLRQFNDENSGEGANGNLLRRAEFIENEGVVINWSIIPYFTRLIRTPASLRYYQPARHPHSISLKRPLMLCLLNGES